MASDDMGMATQQAGAAGVSAVAAASACHGDIDDRTHAANPNVLAFAVLVVGIGAQALAEYSLQRKEDDGNFLIMEYNGDLGFDPLSLLPGTGAGTVATHNPEVKVGRLAMIGDTASLFRELVAKDR